MEGTLDLNSGRVGVEREDQESYLEDEDILGFVYFNFFRFRITAPGIIFNLPTSQVLKKLTFYYGVYGSFFIPLNTKYVSKISVKFRKTSAKYSIPAII